MIAGLFQKVLTQNSSLLKIGDSSTQDSQNLQKFAKLACPISLRAKVSRYASELYKRTTGITTSNVYSRVNCRKYMIG